MHKQPPANDLSYQRLVKYLTQAQTNLLKFTYHDFQVEYGVESVYDLDRITSVVSYEGNNRVNIMHTNATLAELAGVVHTTMKREVPYTTITVDIIVEDLNKFVASLDKLADIANKLSVA